MPTLNAFNTFPSVFQNLNSTVMSGAQVNFKKYLLKLQIFNQAMHKWLQGNQGLQKSTQKYYHYCEAIYICSNLFGWWKMTKILWQIFIFVEKANIGCLFFFCLWSILKGWSESYEIHTMYSSWHVQKKIKKDKKFSGQPFIVNFTFEILRYLKYLERNFFYERFLKISGANLFLV